MSAGLISKLVRSVVVGVVVTLVLILVGLLLDQLKVSIATTVGGFLQTWGAVIGVLAALWYFFQGSTL